jgi:hypothetical protein
MKRKDIAILMICAFGTGMSFRLLSIKSDTAMWVGILIMATILIITFQTIKNKIK